MTKRLIWIDHLKGIAILLVIIGHLIIDSGIEGDSSDPVKWFIYTFHMPLFFFLSGIVLSKFPTLNKLGAKLLIFLTPFIVVGIGYTSYLGVNLHDFTYDKDKYGYWYLFVLAIFYLFHYIMGIPKKFRIYTKWNELCIALVFFVILWLTTKLPYTTQGLLSSLQLYFNWPFFVTGYLLRNHIVFVKKKTMILPMSLIVYIVSAIVFSQTQILGTMTYYLRGMGMIIFLTSLFYENRNIEDSFIGKKLAYIGTKTLDIYIYHYFVKLVITLTLFGSWIYDDKYYIFVIALSIVLAVLISYISINIGKTIRFVPVLSNIVYGKSFKE